MFINFIRLILIVLIIFIMPQMVSAETLELEQNKLYLLTFDKNIKSYYSNKDIVDAQLLNTIYNSNNLLIMLKEERGFLQVMADDDFYKFEIKKGEKSDLKNLVEIDTPFLVIPELDLPSKLGEL